MGKLIEDYGLIGDGQTAALVNRSGSIDWLCWPRFDSDACFAALLGTSEHGRWLIEPIETAKSSRRYQPETLVLETDLETDAGALRLTDFMPIQRSGSAIVRIVTGLRGKVCVRTELNLRFDYGSMTPWIDRDGDAMIGGVGPDLVVLRASVPIRADGAVIRAEFDLAVGDEVAFVLAYGNSARAPPAAIDVKTALNETKSYWTDWIGRFDKETDWPEAVRRSLLTLKALIYRPTGAIVAAPTTSLPEAPGGKMNWDYRYSWLRDATFTLSALLNAGFEAEAEAWRDWLLRAVAGDPEKMRIMYRVDGSRRLEEWTVPWLPGFRWSPPVRVGNAASAQLQLDVYGEVVDTLHLAAKAGVKRSGGGASLEEAIVRHVEGVWRQPDQGLWELRGEPRHYVYSKVSAWVAVDRYVSGHENKTDADKVTLARMTELSRCMRDEICREGFDAGLGVFVSYYGSPELDASLLLLPLVGFLGVKDERISSTIAAIERDLVEDGFVRRWRSRGENSEGAFLACTCWLAECQAMQGRLKTARETFERVLSARNDLGLLAEEYDVRARHLSGNFPQALSHLALVGTALSLCGSVVRRGAGQ